MTTQAPPLGQGEGIPPQYFSTQEEVFDNELKGDQIRKTENFQDVNFCGVNTEKIKQPRLPSQ
jgi:polyisoprenoid-binding protein YceI